MNSLAEGTSLFIFDYYMIYNIQGYKLVTSQSTVLSL